MNFSFRPLTRIHLLLTDHPSSICIAGFSFPTSDEDSSTPDKGIVLHLCLLQLCFRPLTRIHLLLTPVIVAGELNENIVSDL